MPSDMRGSLKRVSTLTGTTPKPTIFERLKAHVSIRMLFLWIVLLNILGCLLVGVVILFDQWSRTSPSKQPSLLRRWGGFEHRPLNNKCYREERTATLLSIFLGLFGVDQWYAHHWVLATFKMLTLGGWGVWAVVDVVLWVVGGVYGTPGCPGGRSGWY
ncbi:hypothetical protein BO94DRAFT_591008 [Aspergillus sclerotioniger CBS 115572]|uniref:TM2 domain-containing protein n=1 Tax=Aspergillus sclerotioniger CBS 115572 TaxID=1450535 RepID=A0A317V246_9EURO|nr:hypothetical protein BO94DRAFT_591008 [Aspergillus sclerotioniger CBS 115572]PWY67098.1 hypothetical protein BO94DRAFT_591008 [Aspergillus sclerotioniger CBS 115572]